jgi:hypothetical protein
MYGIDGGCDALSEGNRKMDMNGAIAMDTGEVDDC